MVNHSAMLLALRAKITTLSVCTTGAIALGATSTGGLGGGSAFTRPTGSFVADGFAQGMEFTTSGTANLGPYRVTAITPTLLSVDGTLTDEVAASGRTLTVGLPSNRAWENNDLAPNATVPYVTEQYLPGPMTKLTTGPTGILAAEPMYVLTFFAPTNAGVAPLYALADAVLALFAPTTNLALSTGDTLRVRGDVAPYRGQLVPHAPGWSRVVVTVPLRCYTANSI